MYISNSQKEIHCVRRLRARLASQSWRSTTTENTQANKEINDGGIAIPVPDLLEKTIQSQILKQPDPRTGPPIKPRANEGPQ